MLTVNHITSLISINWITGSKRYYLNWFFSRNLTVKCQCLNISSCIIKTRLAFNKREGGGAPFGLNWFLLQAAAQRVSVLHKNLYRILKQHPFCKTVTIKSWHPPVLLVRACHRPPASACQRTHHGPRESLQSMWRLYKRPELLRWWSLGFLRSDSQAALPSWAVLIISAPGLN